MFEGKHSAYNIRNLQTNVAIQMDRVNYLPDVPTHSLGSENTYLHEGEPQVMYKDMVCTISLLNDAHFDGHACDH